MSQRVETNVCLIFNIMVHVTLMSIMVFNVFLSTVRKLDESENERYVTVTMSQYSLKIVPTALKG